MPTEKELINGILSKSVNMDDTGVASLYNEDGTLKDDSLTNVLSVFEGHIQKIKSEGTKKTFDDGYKKGQSESLTKLERDFLEKTGYKSEKKGVELFLDYSAEVQKKAGTIDEDTIKKQPYVLRMVEEFENKLKATREDGENKLKQFQSEIIKKETLGKVLNKAETLFQTLKPILPKEPAKAKAQIELFLEKLSAYEYEIKDDIVIISKDGKLLEDKYGHAIKFDTLVRDAADKYFDFQVTDPKSSPGNENGSGIYKKIIAPKNQEELNRLLSDSSIPVEERIKAKEAFYKQN